MGYVEDEHEELLHTVEASSLTASSSSSRKTRLVRVWKDLDRSYLKPWLTECQPTLLDTLPKCCAWLAHVFTTKAQVQQRDAIHRDAG